jgi:triacylglycerol lipase
MVTGLASLISTISGAPTLPQNSLAAARSLSSVGAAAFNRRFPAGAPTSPCGSGPAVVAGIPYYSASGTSVVTNLFDPDSVLAITGRVFGSEANDGLVSRCSSRWGMVLRDNYPWNHMDIVNQSFGLRGWFSPDPLAFYRTHANRLKLAGL